jgi:homoserine O-acetyltransferase
MTDSPGIGTVETLFFTFGSPEEPHRLRATGSLDSVTVAYETYGQLNAERSNAVLVFHALSGSQHAAGHNPAVPGVGGRWTEECHTGWWDGFIGPGRALDTDKFFVICANCLGGCYGSTGPSSIDPATGRPYGGTFPYLGLADMVDVQLKLLDHLGIGRLHAVVGSSLGGMLSLSLATRHPERVKRVIPICAGLTVTTLQRIHNLEQIYAIEQDPCFNDGNYYDRTPPDRGLALARMIAHKTYVSLSAMEDRARTEIVEPDEGFKQYRVTHPVESYMLHQGDKFVRRFDANTYLRIAVAWLHFNLLTDAGAESFQALFKPCRHQRYMVFSVDSDVCYYPGEQRHMVAEIKGAKVPCRHITVHSDKGHDAFLLEPELFAPHLQHTLESDW